MGLTRILNPNSDSVWRSKNTKGLYTGIEVVKMIEPNDMR